MARGPVHIVEAAGNHFKATIVLCRRGGWTTKPFCDGTRSRIGFAAATHAVQESAASGE